MSDVSDEIKLYAQATRKDLEALGKSFEAHGREEAAVWNQFREDLKDISRVLSATRDEAMRKPSWSTLTIISLLSGLVTGLSVALFR